LEQQTDADFHVEKLTVATTRHQHQEGYEHQHPGAWLWHGLNVIGPDASDSVIPSTGYKLSIRTDTSRYGCASVSASKIQGGLVFKEER
jgi:hypothetical protein